MPPECSAVVFYDGVCAMCNGIVHFVLSRDRKKYFCFVALQSDVGRRLLLRHGRTPDALDTMYVMTGYQRPDERVLERSSAALEILRHLDGIWRVISWLRLVPAPMRDFVYGLIVRNRYRVFGRYDSCPLAPPEWRAQFIHEDEVSGGR